LLIPPARKTEGPAPSHLESNRQERQARVKLKVGVLCWSLNVEKMAMVGGKVLHLVVVIWTKNANM
jgi:hypothetical protein